MPRQVMLPAHPQALAPIRAQVQSAPPPSPMPSSAPSSAPSKPVVHPGQLGQIRNGGGLPGPGVPPGPPPANPFPGQQNPGAFAQPAPFNPLQALMQLSGQLGIARSPMLMPRGPFGAFDLAPEEQRPGRRNPFRVSGA